MFIKFYYARNRRVIKCKLKRMRWAKPPPLVESLSSFLASWPLFTPTDHLFRFKYRPFLPILKLHQGLWFWQQSDILLCNLIFICFSRFYLFMLLSRLYVHIRQLHIQPLLILVRKSCSFEKILICFSWSTLSSFVSSWYHA